MRRALLAAIVAIGCCLGALPAVADPRPLPSVRIGASIGLESLPRGHVPTLPTGTPPAAIRAAEQVAGLFVTAPPPSGQKASALDGVFTFVFGSREEAKSRLEGDNEGSAGATTCLADGVNALGQEPELVDDREEATTSAPARPRDWPAQLSSNVLIQVRPGVQVPAVHAIHAERLVADGEGMALEVTDAWVDGRTRGARLIAHGRLPLARVFSGPNDLEVYAAHDGDAVQIVARAPIAAAPGGRAVAAQQIQAILGSLFVALPDGTSDSADCGHMRFTLRATRTHAEMATLQGAALLDPLDGEQPAPPNVPREEVAARALSAMRRRAFVLSVSASQTTADHDVVVSFSLGWAGRERPAGT